MKIKNEVNQLTVADEAVLHAVSGYTVTRIGIIYLQVPSGIICTWECTNTTAAINYLNNHNIKSL